MKIVLGYQNTKLNGEDFALTPYLFLVNPKGYKSLGVGICWFHHSVFMLVGFGKIPLPKFITFLNLSRKNG